MAQVSTKREVRRFAISLGESCPQGRLKPTGGVSGDRKCAGITMQSLSMAATRGIEDLPGGEPNLCSCALLNFYDRDSGRDISNCCGALDLLCRTNSSLACGHVSRFCGEATAGYSAWVLDQFVREELRDFGACKEFNPNATHGARSWLRCSSLSFRMDEPKWGSISAFLRRRSTRHRPQIGDGYEESRVLLFMQREPVEFGERNNRVASAPENGSSDRGARILVPSAEIHSALLTCNLKKYMSHASRDVSHVVHKYFLSV